MKDPVIFVLLLQFFIYAQFTSGTDYSAKHKDQRDNGYVTGHFNFGNSETEWNRDLNDASLTVRSDVFTAGFGVKGMHNFDNTGITYDMTETFYSVSGSGTLDTIPDDQGGNYNFDTADIEFSLLQFGTGIEYLNTYGIYFFGEYISFDKGANGLQSGAGVSYNLNYSEDKGLLFSFELSGRDIKEPFSDALSYARLRPDVCGGIRYRTGFSTSELEIGLKYSEYDKEITGKLAGSYFKISGSYIYNVKRLGASFMIKGGSNFTGELEQAKEILPYFYYDAGLIYSLSRDRFNITAGWRYSITDSEIPGNSFSEIPEEYQSVNNITEQRPDNVLYLKLKYKY